MKDERTQTTAIGWWKRITRWNASMNVKDERIETTRNRIAARAYLIVSFLLLISISYRMWILKQRPREFWDIFAIWVIGVAFGFTACAKSGVFAHKFKGRFLGPSIVLVIFLTVLHLVRGQIHSIADLSVSLIGGSIGIGLVIAAAYFLNERWKRKEGIEDEK